MRVCFYLHICILLRKFRIGKNFITLRTAKATHNHTRAQMYWNLRIDIFLLFNFHLNLFHTLAHTERQALAYFAYFTLFNMIFMHTCQFFHFTAADVAFPVVAAVFARFIDSLWRQRSAKCTNKRKENEPKVRNSLVIYDNHNINAMSQVTKERSTILRCCLLCAQYTYTFRHTGTYM